MSTDLASDEFTSPTNRFCCISAKNLTNIESLIDMIKAHIFQHYVKVTLSIPYDRGNLVSYLNEVANVFETEYLEKGTIITVECS